MCTSQLKPHVHADVIKAWADGSPIQRRDGPADEWRDMDTPMWYEHYEYRVKPTHKTPGQIAFEAYWTTTAWAPTWEKSSKSLQKKWEEVAIAVLDHERSETIKSAKGEM